MVIRPLQWALAAGGLALAIASGVTVYAELMPLIRLGVTTPGKVDSLSEAVIAPGPSYRSKLLVLNACNESLNSLDAATLPPERLQSLQEHCGAVARAVEAVEPSYSLAYYVQALIAEARGEAAPLSVNLMRSQWTAPGQGWLALSRAIVAARHLEQLDSDALLALDSDIATLTRSGRGSEWLAQSYNRGGALAERIISIVERLPSDQQMRFLDNVRRLTTQ
mgnify:CR=1 FL=1|tara:strand:- start:4566 stop:5231 length:666 start_codon:yes stop_codon:yes gene_type:complete